MFKKLIDSSRTTDRGFTIVELLVVIVVIAILAAISSVAYNGVKERAEQSMIITHVRQYETIIERYIIDNGVAPLANWRCLGDATTLPAENGYEENYCFSPANAGTVTGDSAPADPALMTLLKDVNGGSLPRGNFPEVEGFTVNHNGSWVTRKYRGVIYDSDGNNFNDNSAILMYYTKFAKCPIGERIARFSDYNSNRSGCAVKLSINRHGQPRGVCVIGC